MCKIALTLQEIKEICQRFDAKHEPPRQTFNKKYLRISHFGDPIGSVGEVIEKKLKNASKIKAL